jgi:hypothetical protein
VSNVQSAIRRALQNVATVRPDAFSSDTTLYKWRKRIEGRLTMPMPVAEPAV